VLPIEVKVALLGKFTTFVGCPLTYLPPEGSAKLAYKGTW